MSTNQLVSKQTGGKMAHVTSCCKNTASVSWTELQIAVTVVGDYFLLDLVSPMVQKQNI